ncbi:DUF4266 domain-containing protein [Colwellia sp. C1TZA3]|uniref:DUF4266 domain-containing protein n=1 Tax=Colwellia sp. C1TZA3 TaxID=2508879 RepID=UPI0011BA2472|nr:DUF4266 domain-containing protein [Colwellia sp. C1TZA3]TWX73367.1 DUF4266 domain-containing protein [Colwellia sp. C1TZA3]
MKIFEFKKNDFKANLALKIARLSLLSAAVILVSGCSSLGVQPWERDLLAKEEMALTSSAIDSALDDHIYFSKEASSGGKGFGGGGCGCN